MSRSMRAWGGPLALALAGAGIGAGAADSPAPRELAASVVEVASGDTLVVVDGAGERYEVRLADIGAPQGSEYYAPAARNLLLGIVEGRPLRVEVTGVSPTGRPEGEHRSARAHLYGRLYAGKLDVNLELVRRGAAWLCLEYALDTSYLPYESDARRWRRGLWAHTWEIDTRVACRRRPPAERPVSPTPPATSTTVPPPI